MPAETLVGVLASRSCQTIVTFLGILKANLAYLPLDVNVPAARVAAILSALPGYRVVLVGLDVSTSDLQLPDVELVQVDDILSGQDINGSSHARDTMIVTSPSATSLAYTIFTSGSTGRPKGVMVEHRGIVRLVKQSNVVARLPPAARVAHLSNIAFDASVWEIYSSLLNGGTLVCIDYLTSLDPRALGAVFIQEQIRASMLPPALLKQCLVNNPSALSMLELLFVAGDRFDGRDAVEAQKLICNGVYNAYGPTENTILSTIHNIGDGEPFVNGVPIGRAISNSGAYIMDPQQQLVPLGVMGELVLTGDGLARGYTDPFLNVDRFVQVNIDGQLVKAYRTGDRVRYRPKDGQIEFFGRMDQQIKIRGHRIEPAEVEHAMLGHEGVRDAAVVVLRSSESQEPEMVAFACAQLDGASEQNEASKQVEGWGGHFETNTYTEINTIDTSIIGRDFMGWTSMYDGSQIDIDEMQEWLDDTMRSLLDGQSPGHVLEIGTGTGMILFNLGDGLESYTGLDPSKSAVAFVTRAANSIPDLAGRVEVHIGTATDTDRLDGLRPGLVILNSVVQYFPTPEYLVEVVEALARIPGVRRLFFGDVRSLAMNRDFLASRALRSLGDKATKKAIRRKMVELEECEEEMLIDPAFFTGLVSRLPDQVERVEILPKCMRATNELSSYRYAAIVHIRGSSEKSPSVVYDVHKDSWIDFRSSKMDRDGLVRFLEDASSGAAAVAISNIPYSKTTLERHIVEALDWDGADANTDTVSTSDGVTWISAARNAAKCCASLSASELVQIAEDTGFRVEISWARQRLQHGGLDAVFHHCKPVRPGARGPVQFPVDEQARPLAQLVNRPLQRLQNRHVESQIRERLKTLLPSYMVPSRIVALDQMPINANRKVDRSELVRRAEVAPAIKASAVHTAPRNDTEAALCEEFGDILGIEVGVTDDFFDLGGHSLMATKLAARISRRLDARVSVKDVFDYPVLADLAASIRLGSSKHSPIASTVYQGPVEQSFAQGRLWFLDQLNVGTSWYLMPFAARLRGPLHQEALAAALLALEQRHEPLRTTFVERDGTGMQVVHRSQAKELRVIDVSSAGPVESYSELLRREQTTPFDLNTEPGWRVSLLRLTKEDYVLSIVMHHIISDGWSMDILRKELGRFYSAALRGLDPQSVVSPLPIQYRDFAAWQKQDKQAAEHKRQLSYWVKQLVDNSPAEFLPDWPRPAILSGQAGLVELSIDGPVYERLQAFCRTHQVTLFVVLLAAFRITHYRLTGAEDATIGTPIANRNRPELEDLIGFFVNTQCMRIVVEHEQTFSGLVRQIRSIATTAFANQDVPFERIVSALLPGKRDTSRNPLVQLMFAVHSQKNLGKFQFEGLVGEQVGIEPTTRFDVEFHLFQGAAQLGGSVLYSTELFEPDTIDSMVTVFKEVLQRSLEHPQIPIASLPFTDGLAGLRTMGLLEMEETEYPRDSSVVDVFCNQVAVFPDAVAVKDSATELTYVQLDQQSDKVAAWLRRRRMPAETLVGVLASRSCQTIVTFLGILKANLAYLPLDVNAPAARVAAILSAVAGHRLVLMGVGVPAPDLQLLDVELVSINNILTSPDINGLSQAKEAAISTAPLATSLAYAIFTSGSTGRPKGVMVEHRGIVRLVKQSNIVARLPPAARVAHLSNIAFDASIWEIYTALLNGGTLICIDYLTSLDNSMFRAVLRREQIQISMLPPALLKQCLTEDPASLSILELLFVAGDRFDGCDAVEAQRLIGAGVYNAYGPTENAILSTIYNIGEGESFVNGVPIGRAVSNSGAYIMDPDQQLVPPGVIGELVVTGDGLARGYTDSALDINRFVRVSINNKSVRAYRTGDRARHRPKDGQIEFFGRMDQQIKIRGHRVEPAEVEQTIIGHPSVRDAAVVVLRNSEGQEPEMVAFAAASRADDASEQNEASKQVEGWGGHFETSTYTEIGSIDASTIGKDFMGWTSMYDGSQIDVAEMQEWLDETMQSLLDGQAPGHVLEIGTGTGMILFNLGNGLESYTGLEPSRSAAAFVSRTAKSILDLGERVEVHVGTATDAARLDSLRADLVVVNSVAQYFPTPEYLTEVVETLVRIPGVRRLFFGDMRSHAINRDFLASRALRSLGDKATKTAMRRKMAELEEREEELLVDPAFFTGLVNRLPDQVEHVEILPKRMKATNELSSYRYAAVIHIRGPPAQTQPVLYEVEKKDCVDFASSKMDRDGLLRLLRQASPGAAAVAVSNIPYSKTILERHVVEALDRDDSDANAGGAQDGVAWISAARSAADRCASLSASDLTQIGDELDLRVELSWARQRSQHGGIDAVFHHYPPPKQGARVPFRFPTEEQGRPLSSLTNRPLQRLQNRHVEAQIRERLKALLPSYMVPTRILALDQLPVNANGKVDRRALTRRAETAQAVKPSSSSVPMAPRDETEAALCEEFAHVLGIEVGVNDNFFDLGGHSLTATKLAARISRRLDARVSVKDVFDRPVLADLAAAIRRGSSKHRPIPSTIYTSPVEQSFAQGRLWFLDQLEVGASWYLMPFSARLRGPLHRDALATTLLAIEQRHETLRTTFVERDGVGMQVVHAFQAKELRVIDLSSTEPADNYFEALQREQTTPFDLATEPGWRVSLLRLGEDDHILSIVMHHIISDGWSFDILRQELAKFYTAALRSLDPLSQVSPLPIQYRDFAVWQKEDEQAAEHKRQLDYWTTQLADSSPAELLTDLQRPAVLTGRAGIIQLAIEGPLYERLQAFCRTHQVTSFVVLLAAFRATHYRLTGAEDATIGTPIANRNRPELEDLIGFFVNTQCMRIIVEHKDTFDTLVQQVRSIATAAFSNQDVPFERIVSALLPGSRDTSRNPFVQLIFAVHSQKDLGKIQLEGLVGEQVGTEPTTRFDLEFHLLQEATKLGGSVLYSTELFEPDTVDSMVTIFKEILQRGLEQPQIPIISLPLTNGLANLDSIGLLDIEETDYLRDLSIVDIFREQVALFPDTVAVKDSSTEMSYTKLDQQSDKVAAWLRRRRLAAETLVGVLAPRSCQTIATFLGILKANLAYLPLDVNVPAVRVAAILSAVAGRRLVLLGIEVSVPDLQLPNVDMVHIDHILSDHDIESSDYPRDATSPTATSLAYTIFTSGSTGRPKGVMVEHRGIIRLVKQSNVVARLPPAARVAHLSNIAFDASVWEVYAALLNGGTLVCIDYLTSLDPTALGAIFTREQICVSLLSPALLKQCLVNNPSALSTLELLFVGGDRFDGRDAVEAQKLVRNGVYNAYGPTENTILSTIHNIGDGEPFVNGVPIGRAVSNSGAYIMDPQQQLVPPGVIGELVVTGDGLARGYTDPALNAGRFVQLVLRGRLVRAYRTGDRVRYRPKDGQIEFFGRMDQQIKIRGHRIEPAEVEHAILGHEAVRDAAIVVLRNENQESEIVAFIAATRVDHHSEQNEATKQVEGSGGDFKMSAYAEIESIDTSAIGKDFTGWTSTYDGSQINTTEMQEWLDDTMQSLLDGQPPGHILEIGTGTGMILFNLGDRLESYVGLDPSKSTAAFVNRTAKSLPALAGRVKVHVGTATDAARLDRLRADLVVVNSVAQHFPTPEYLAEVIGTLVRIPGVSRLFFGDVRSYAINRHFLASRALRELGDKATKMAIRRRMAELEEREEELLVDPAFFTELASRLPDQIERVEILPKRMQATNELSAYRYAAVVHVRSPSDRARSVVYNIHKDSWIDFRSSKMDRDGIVRLLKDPSYGAAVVALSNIPYSKTILERHVVEALDKDDDADADVGDGNDSVTWISAARSAADRCASLSASDLAQIGDKLGFRVEISWARQRSQHGGVDAVFHRYEPPSQGARVAIRFPVEEQARPSTPLTNRPRRRLQNRHVEAQIRERLRSLLPSYMVPARIVTLDQMPVNASGKVDRRELARRAEGAPAAKASAAKALAARVVPRNNTEAVLCEEFADVLGVEVGVTDNFFDLGGHSLRATKLAARISRRLDTRISVKDIFAQPVLGDLAASIIRGSRKHRPIPRTMYSGPLEQSFAQARLWFLDQLNIDSPWYLMPFATRLRGVLDRDALSAALQAIERRHETLRTTFEDRDGVGVQVIHEFQPKALRVIDISAENADGGCLEPLREEQTTPFNLTAEPGWRVSLLRLGQDDHILSIVMHHIVSDGWSIDILRQELGLFYTAALQGQDPLSQIPALPTQYRDFAEWQKQEDQVADHQRQLDYWSKQLADSAPAELLCDKPRPAVLQGAAGAIQLTIEGPVYEKLNIFCRAQQTTPFAVLLAVFRATHYRLTGATDATIGTPIANRNRPELENMIGFFVNTQCMRLVIEEGDTFHGLIQQVRSTASAAHENQDVPFERIVSALLPKSRDTSRNPLVQLMFALHSQQDLGNMQLEGLEGEQVGVSATTRFDFEFHLLQKPQGLAGHALYSSELFEAETVQGIVAVFKEILQRGLEQPHTPIGLLPLSDGLAELRTMGLLEMEKTEYPRDSSVIDVFRDQVAAFPDAVAVKDSVTELSYAQLDQQSDRVAVWLRHRRMPGETLVGVLAPRSCETIITFLGILKASLAYLPLDINTPSARTKAILSAVNGLRLVLLGPDAPSGEIQLPDVELLQIGDVLSRSDVNGTSPPGNGAMAAMPSATNLAYAIFTSGSTGRPKGVMVEHRSILRLVKQTNALAKLPIAARIAHLSNIAFDGSVWEVYSSLLNGGTLVCIDYLTSFDSTALGAAFAREQIQVSTLSPALLKECLANNPTALRTLELLFVAGDRFDGRDAIEAQKLIRTAVYNAYGPTENGVMSVLYEVGHGEHFVSGVPIGRAISNSGAYIMNLHQELVPIGVMGELVVTGDGLARGYTDPALNAGRFMQVSIDGRLVRAYRTGDRARYRPKDGQIEFFGRMDNQIKIRGHRIEPAEVEQAILGHPSIRDAAVVVLRSHEGQEPEMVAFATAQADRATEQSEASKQVEGWGGHFETNTYTEVESIDTLAIGKDFMGWISMYDGSQIDISEMQEWLDDTMRSLLDGQAPGHVLEIGTGTGMILFNLGDGLESYVGIDPSASAATFVARTAKSIPALSSRVEMHVGTATDAATLEGLRPNLVILNSVVQYFPTPEYLTEVVETLARIPGVSRLFFGDIRSHAINRDFLAARALRGLDGKATKHDIRRKMAEVEEREEELLVDPAFFTRLASQLPDRIEHVEILPKRMRATNELSSYRYAAVVHIRGSLGQSRLAPREIQKEDWVDFRATRMDHDGLVRLLRQASPDEGPIAISNIPSSKTIVERHIVKALDEDNNAGAEVNARGLSDRIAWILAARSASECCASLSASDLVQMGEEAGLRVELSWARQRSQHGALDAVFHRYTPANQADRIVFRFPTDDKDQSLGQLTNRPLQRLQNRHVEAQIRERLQALLPSYMMPARIVALDHMPVNANGKVDRRELMRRVETAPAAKPSSARVTPRNETEAALCEEFADVLGVEVGVTDNFFDLGGHSLMATKLAARISRRLNARVSVKEVFDYPVLADLAASIRLGSSKHSPIAHTDYSGPVEQSFAQGRLWFLDQLNVGTSWYLMPFAARLRGPLNLEALSAALLAVEQRHETLRTTFVSREGTGMQVVHAFQAKELRVIDLSSAEPAGSYLGPLQRDQTTSFDLTVEPGWRVSLIRLAADDHVLSIVMHHIVSDGWSIDVLRQELGRFYTAALRGLDPLSEVGPLPIQYRDFAAWQRQDERAAEHQRQLNYWTTQLADSSPAEFLTDRPRPARPSGHAGIVQLTVEGPVYERLQAFCRAHQVTSFVVLLAAFRATHYRLTGAEDATIGTPIANRNRPELENMIGFFVNTQCMRVAMGSQDTFDGLVQQVRSTATAAFANQDVPFERIVSALLPGSRDTSRNPLVQIIFAVHSQRDLGKIHLEGLASEPVGTTATTRFDLEFHMSQEARGLSGNVVYSAELFEPETVNGMVAVFQEILRRGLEQPQISITSLALTDGLVNLRKMGLLDIEQTGYPHESSVVDVFCEQASAYHDRIAIKDSFLQLTYAQLHQLSDELAVWLRRRYMTAETLVGVLASRSWQTIVAFLGVLKANLAYLPLDVNAPPNRIVDILSATAGLSLVLLGQDTPGLDLQLPDVELVPINDILNRCNIDGLSRLTNPTTDRASITAVPSARSLAYVIFTSGSTGRPKGVMVEHRSILRLVKQTNALAKLPTAARIAHLSNIAFDGSVWEVYSSLLNGGTLVCIDYLTSFDSMALGAAFAREQIQVSILSPALLKECLANNPATLRTLELLFVGGDRFDGRNAIEAQKLVHTAVYNAYGPTENGVMSVLYEVGYGEHFVGGVPIGRAISNSGAYIMNVHQELVPLGVMGELVVTGDGLARGYTDSTLNADRFVQVTINGEMVRAYRTGDRARFRPKDGQIEFFGRMDNQIKIRGHRIEPAEVEHALLRHPSIRDAAIIVLRSHEGQEPEMVAFATAQIDRATEQNEASKQVEGWGGHFETNIYKEVKSINASTIGKDFIGWTSMYDGSHIDVAEMQEWLDDTIQTLLDGQAPGHVLEIGTGTGMILFNLGHGLESYVGIDPSASAAAFVAHTAQSIPALAGRVQVHLGTATDTTRLSGLRPDLVVLNSVVQYFPTPEYLLEVVEMLARMPVVRRLFFGDIRSYAINRDFLASQALHLLGDKATKTAILRKMAELEEREEELLVDPSFFTGLANRFPDQIEHVEILPKRMRATNELSSYRYAAVVHIRGPSDKAPPVVYDVNKDSWIDFRSSEMDRNGLVRLLAEASPDVAAVAISNIPYSKTILERHIVEALGADDANFNTDAGPMLDGAAWLSTARSAADRCPALSASDLAQVGEEAGFSVEVSCARQRSQHGALDAVFHRYAPTEQGARITFRFPTDDLARPLDSATNRPLQRLQNRQIEAQIGERLQALLPSYMVPARIILLDQMPVNANGKVDRRELVHRAETVPSFKPSTARVAPRNATEEALCIEFAGVLGVEVGPTDSFFELGGDSLMATKLAARISRRLDTHVSVKHVFDQPVLADLAIKISIDKGQVHSTNGRARQPAGSVPFQLLPFEDSEDFVEREILPQLKHYQCEILDVYQATWTQKLYLNDPATGLPRTPPLFFVDFPPESDSAKLDHACAALVQHFDIFRTVFLLSAGKFYQVVLENIDIPVEVVEIEEDFTNITRKAVDANLRNPLCLGQPLLRFIMLKNRKSALRLVLLISHALYDGLSLGYVMQALHSLYNGSHLLTPPKFSRYIQHMGDSRNEGYSFWRSILVDSEMAVLNNTGAPRQQPESEGSWLVSKIINAPVRVNTSSITQATVFNTACALMLAKQTGKRDILFSRVVSGRQSLPIDCQDIVGPCTNDIPVRVRVSRETSLKELLFEVQNQYLNSLPFETLGFEELKENCTDWPNTTTTYGCRVAYQNFDMRFESQIQNQRLRLSDLSQGRQPMRRNGNTVIERTTVQGSPLYDVDVMGIPEPDGIHLRVVITVNKRCCEEATVDGMLHDLCEGVLTINSALHDPESEVEVGLR